MNLADWRDYPKGCIRTYSGKIVDLRNPKPEQICIEDIAHALSLIPRFCGHTKHHLSVATHSINACTMIEAGFELEALLHDATEAYLQDIPSPLKALLPEYKQIESNFHKVIAEKFGVPETLSQEVKDIDLRLLNNEWSQSLLFGLPSTTYLPVDQEQVFIDLFNHFKNI